MMDWLGGWLRSVVLIVLMAVIIDMLLPNNAIQRYVRLVISLFLLLTMLTPIFHLMSKNWDIANVMQQAEAAASRFLPKAGKSDDRLSWNEIVRQATKMQDHTEMQAQQLLEEHAAAWITEEIDREYGAVVKAVNVNAVVDARGEASIGLVTVSLSREAIDELNETEPMEKEEAGSATAGEQGIRLVEPIARIDPVRIEITPFESSVPQRLSSSEGGLSPALESHRDRIQRMIHDRLQIPLGQIIVTFS